MGPERGRRNDCDRSLTRGSRCALAYAMVAAMEPWERAGVTHEEWVAARLQAAALVRAIENGEPEAVAFILRRGDDLDPSG